MNLVANSSFYMASAPSISIAILIIPLFDTLRVFVIRIIRNGSPFKADRRHIHHLLLAMNLTHLQASCVLFVLNILVIAFAFAFQHLGILWLGFIELIVMIVFTSVLDLSVKRKKKAGEPINYCDV
jgi:UDP-N-acetylmuramyl pentapeptide phosphotransferase/UDP-N-acetylglucosamine-1-phosphate transferase